VLLQARAAEGPRHGRVVQIQCRATISLGPVRLLERLLGSSLQLAFVAGRSQDASQV
jgi:hypothetical protein